MPNFRKDTVNKKYDVIRPYSIDTPNICKIFEKHLREGNSPRTFVAMLKGSDRAYAHLKATSKRFYELAEAHTKSNLRRGYLHYNPEGINNHRTPHRRARNFIPKEKHEKPKPVPTAKPPITLPKGNGNA
jgi:hypothetical protein